jgi:hypothetical protein
MFLLPKIAAFEPPTEWVPRLRLKTFRKPLRMQVSGFSNRLSPFSGPGWFLVDYEVGTPVVPCIAINLGRGSGLWLAGVR